MTAEGAAQTRPARSIALAFEQVADSHPEAIAIEAGSQRLAYAELDALANRLATQLIDHGIGPGDIVGVLAERGVRTVVGMLATLKAGAAYAPLDPDSPPLRLEELLRQARARLVIAPEHLRTRLEGDERETIALDPDLRALADEPDRRPAPTAAEEDLFAVLFTSGTTGTPKPVALEHRNLLSLLANAPELRPRPAEGALHVCAAQFDVAAYEIWATLLSGGRLVCHRPGRPDPRELCQTVTDHEVGWMALATSIFHQLAEYGPRPLAGVRMALVGGEPLLPRCARSFHAACPKTRVFNIYGPAETTVFVCAHELGEEIDRDDPIPIGRPIAGVRVLVADERGRQLPRGRVGELHIAGPGVTRGYLHRSAEAAGTHGDDEQPRTHPSGDLVRERDDGALEILGRLDSQVKISGFRVSPAEIEAKLANHPGVRQAAVVAHSPSPGRRRLLAFVATDELGIDEDSLRGYLAARVPAYMLPHEIALLDQLPMGPTGKLDRSALPLPTTAPVASGPRATGDGDLDTTTAIFAEVLGLPGIVAGEDFLDLGGDSLTAVQLLARLRERFDVELPISAIFEGRTPEAVHALVRAAPRRGDGDMPDLRRRHDRSEPVAASAGQAKALLVGEMAEESLPYQSQAMHRIIGTIDVPALERALTRLIARHEIFRTTFERERGTWFQRVHDPRPIRLAVADLSNFEDPERALTRHFAECCAWRMNPAELPLARWSLARLAPEDHAFIAVEHHVVHDGVSTALFLRELADLYAAEMGIAPSDLAPLDVQYRDFAAWQHELVDSEHGRRTLAYWHERLASPPALDLPLDRPRPARQTYRGQTLRITLPDELTERVRQVAREWSATPFMLTLAAHCALLARHGACEELIVGSGLANRRSLASEQLIGMVVNTVALRIDLSGSPSPRELVQRVRDVLLEAQSHQDVPFERVVEHLSPSRRPDAAPLYQTLFSFHDAPVGTIALADATLIPRDALGNGSAKADLSVIAVNRVAHRPDGIDPDLYERLAEDGLTFVWEYNSDLFERSSIERMAQQHARLLEQFVAEEPRAVGSLALESPQELEQRCEGPKSDYERDATIAQVFAARAAETPNAPALSFAGQSLSYRELDRRANRLAHRLRSLGVDRAVRVGVCLERSVEMVIAFVAIAKAGGAYVPLDPNDPKPRLASQLEALDVPLLLSLARHRDQLPGPESRQVCLDDELDLGREPDHAPEGAVSSRDPAYVMFTSGSTGRPNAVETSHRAIVRLVRDVDYVRLGPDETLLALAPAAFDASTFEIWGALLNGCRLAVAPPGALTPGELAELVGREGVTTMWLTAGLLRRVVEDRPELLSGIGQLLSGGEALSPEHVRRALDALPDGAVLVNGYGPTETTTFACAHRLRKGEPVPEPVPIGRPIAGTRVYVLDRHGQPAPIGVTGELFIGGDGVAIGYVDDAALTAERFLPDPFSSRADARMYRSGDLARWRADGTIEFLGRADRQLKLRGFRIEPGEVEARLREHPEVTDALVCPLDRGHGDRVLAAYVVTRGGAEPDDSELRAHAGRTLAAHAVPSMWTRLARLPLTTNGKIDLAALPRPDSPLHGEGSPATDRSLQRLDPLERKLLSIWARALGDDRLDPDDDFFEIGGHSLLAVEVFDAIERSLGLRLPLASIFEAPTVRQLAALLREEGWKSSRGSLVTLKATGKRPPLFFVAAGDGNSVGFGALARRLGPEQPFYALQPRGINGGARLHGSVDAMATHYVRELRRTRKRGPYLLGGRCLGAVVAYEMARKLEARGEEVPLLAVLDSGGPLWQPRLLADGTPFDETMSGVLRRAQPELALSEVFTPEGTQRLLRLLAEQVTAGSDGTPINRYLHELYLKRADVRDAYPDLEGEDAMWFVGWAWTTGREQLGLCERLLPPAANHQWEETPTQGVRASVSELRKRVAWRAAEAADLLTGERREGAAIRRAERVRELSLRAWHGHRAGPYGGVITLIRSEEFLVQPGLERWHFLDSGGVEERHVRGTHRSMMREPDVGSLATCIGELVDSR